jgi:hypothetical protein
MDRQCRLPEAPFACGIPELDVVNQDMAGPDRMVAQTFSGGQAGLVKARPVEFSVLAHTRREHPLRRQALEPMEHGGFTQAGFNISVLQHPADFSIGCFIDDLCRSGQASPAGHADDKAFVVDKSG